MPGGKVEPGEDVRDALVREIDEELSATIVVGDEIDGGPWTISERFELRLFLASVVGDDPRLGPDHDALQWVAFDDINSINWLPSDLPAIESVLRALPG
jgi:8-oxo-dGTP diphosphatase